MLGRADIVGLSVIAAVVTAVCLPLLLIGPQSGHSFEYNISWSTGFAGQLAAGTPYPRWLPELNEGAGSPVFFFYGPVSYYITALGFLGCPGCDPTVKLGIGEWLIVLASGLSFYVFARRLAAPAPAAAAAVLYAVMPYHLYIDVVVRQTAGEAAAFIWLPLIFFFAERLPADRNAAAGLAVTYCLLIATHLPTTMLLSAFLFLHVALLAHANRSARTMYRFAAAIVTGILLSGLYFVPAMFSQDYTSMHLMWTDYYRYDEWFLLDGRESPNADLSDHLTVLLFFCSLAFLVAWSAAFRQTAGPDRRLLATWMIFVAGAWFVMTPASRFLWDMLPFLQKIQLPWRVASLMDFAVAATFLMALARLPARWELPRLLVAGAMALLFVLSVALNAAAGYLAWKVLAIPEHGRDLASRIETGYDAAEYIPAWVELGQKEVWVRLAPMSRVEAPPDGGTADVVEWRPRTILIEVDLRSETELLVRQFYYPGWRATVAGSETVLDLAPADETGLLSLKAPPGRYAIRLELAPLWQERAGAVSSGLGLLLLLTPFAMRAVRRRSKFRRPVTFGQFR